MNQQCFFPQEHKSGKMPWKHSAPSFTSLPQFTPLSREEGGSPTHQLVTEAILT